VAVLQKDSGKNKAPGLPQEVPAAAYGRGMLLFLAPHAREVGRATRRGSAWAVLASDGTG